MSRIESFYVRIRCTVSINDGTSSEDIASRIAEECDYSITHEDDICEIIETEFIDCDSNSCV